MLRSAAIIAVLVLAASQCSDAWAADAGSAPLPAELAQPALPSPRAVAQAAPEATAGPASEGSMRSGIGDYFATWLQRSDAAKAAQPHWMTPLVTVTPRLEQEVRYDQYWQRTGTGASIDLYDSGKGLELIPTATNEVLLNAPPYETRSGKSPVNGWADWPFLTVKQRLFSANEQDGNYIVTAFFGIQSPSGNAAFTNHAVLFTPTIAAGKGFGDFDIQSTLSVAIPDNYGDKLGSALSWNVALQYHLLTYFWPEFETNLTHWYGGLRDTKTQIFLTPGLILGRFPLTDRLRGVIGAGYQFAVSPKLVKEPALTPTYDHAWLMTARVAF